jgi:hypothetical protein
MELVSNVNARQQVRAIASAQLRTLVRTLKNSPAVGDESSHRQMTVEELERFFTRPADIQKPASPLTVPSGDPIGN